MIAGESIANFPSPCNIICCWCISGFCRVYSSLSLRFWVVLQNHSRFTIIWLPIKLSLKYSVSLTSSNIFQLISSVTCARIVLRICSLLLFFLYYRSQLATSPSTHTNWQRKMFCKSKFTVFRGINTMTRFDWRWYTLAQTHRLTHSNT